MTTQQVEKNPTQVTCVDQTRLLVIRSGCVGDEIYLLENPLKLLKGLSLQSPRSDEEENGEGGGVEHVDAPGVEEEHIPEVREARSAEDAHKTLLWDNLFFDAFMSYLCNPLSNKDLAAIRKYFPHGL